MNKPPLTKLDYFTHYVAAYVPLELGIGDDCIDWAIDMIAAGRETEHILVLAACEKPANHFEIDGYLAKALAEIGYPQRGKEDLFVCHASYLIYQLSQEKNIKSNLSKITSLSLPHSEIIDNFEMLYYALDDLEWGYEAQEYWPGATLGNIEARIVQQAQQWLTENDDFLRLK